MTNAVQRANATQGSLAPATILQMTEAALAAAQQLTAVAKSSVTALTTSTGKNDGASQHRHQYATHGFAWAGPPMPVRWSSSATGRSPWMAKANSALWKPTCSWPGSANTWHR